MTDVLEKNPIGRPVTWDPIEEAKALREWAQKDEAIVLRKFAAIRGFHRSYFSEWCKSCKDFSDAYDYAVNMIGSRREELVMLKCHDKGPFERYASFYDKDLKQHELEMRGEGKDTTDKKAFISHFKGRKKNGDS